MKPLVLISALCLATACSRSADAGSNPLIGTWTVAPGQPTCSIYKRVFTATTETTWTRAIGPYPAETGTGEIRYQPADKGAIYVIGPTGIPNAGRWQVIDPNQIRDSSFSDCIYLRAR